MRIRAHILRAKIRQKSDYLAVTGINLYESRHKTPLLRNLQASFCPSPQSFSPKHLVISQKSSIFAVEFVKILWTCSSVG